jgi:selenophosphate synthase
MTAIYLFNFTRSWLNGTIASFVVDPADTPYQEGYLAATKELLDVIKREQKRLSENSNATD